MVSLIDKNSVPVTKSEFDVWQLPSTDISIASSQIVEIPPNTGITDEGPYEFTINPQAGYLSPKDCLIFLQVQILHANDTVLAYNPDLAPENTHPEDAVGICPSFGATFFSMVKIFIGDTLVEYDTDYHLKAYMQMLLTYPEQDKVSLLKMAGYEPNSATAEWNADNEGWRKRVKWGVQSRSMQFLTPIFSSIFLQEKYLLSNLSMRLEFHKTKDNVLLESFVQNPNFKIKVEKIMLLLKRVYPIPSLNTALEKLLLRENAKYALRKLKVHNFHIEQGRSSTPETPLFYNIIPRRLFFFYVTNSAYYGNEKETLFRFMGHTVTSTQLSVNGEIIPVNPIKTDFVNKHILQAYWLLQDTLGYGYAKGGTNSLQMDDFLYGNAIWGVDLTKDSSEETFSLRRSGPIIIKQTFSTIIPAPGLRLIVIAERDGILNLTSKREAIVDELI